jgi:dTDP-4-amino-4,6-dideoxygalactose transaminase
MKHPGMSNDIRSMKPFMPPLGEFTQYLERIWSARQLTNGGPVHEEFEQALCDYLGVKYISLVANGTAGLMIALKALGLKGEVITTPFTSVATVQAIYWNGLKPVFADISVDDFNIDLKEIEKAITPATTAILPVHIFGNPCNVKRIDELARKYNLKVVYDAAHCFGVELDGTSVCNFGDLSVLSFHATKVFNTFEGGAIVCHDESTKKYIDSLKNTGLDTGRNLAGYGINAKMNEIQAAYGLLQLKYIDRVIEQRKTATLKYRELLEDMKGLHLPVEKANVRYNYTYFPVLIDPVGFGPSRDEVADYLEGKRIFTRKYFYPLVSDFPEFSIFKTADLQVAGRIAGNILCLPLYHDISTEEISYIVDSILATRSLSAK